MICHKCGFNPLTQTGKYLKRVNPKGEKGIWECRPKCDEPPVSQDQAVLGAIFGDDYQEGSINFYSAGLGDDIEHTECGIVLPDGSGYVIFEGCLSKIDQAQCTPLQDAQAIFERYVADVKEARTQFKERMASLRSDKQDILAVKTLLLQKGIIK